VNPMGHGSTPETEMQWTDAIVGLLFRPREVAVLFVGNPYLQCRGDKIGFWMESFGQPVTSPNKLDCFKPCHLRTIPELSSLSHRPTGCLVL
jgi:hypothetical protein